MKGENGSRHRQEGKVGGGGGGVGKRGSDQVIREKG